MHVKTAGRSGGRARLVAGMGRAHMGPAGEQPQTNAPHSQSKEHKQPSRRRHESSESAEITCVTGVRRPCLRIRQHPSGPSSARRARPLDLASPIPRRAGCLIRSCRVRVSHQAWDRGTGQPRGPTARCRRGLKSSLISRNSQVGASRRRPRQAGVPPRPHQATTSHVERATPWLSAVPRSSSTARCAELQAGCREQPQRVSDLRGRFLRPGVQVESPGRIATQGPGRRRP